MYNTNNKLVEEDLCTQCGLCCFSFHSIGFIANEQEKKVVQKFGGEIYTNKHGQIEFQQPCPAFNGKCSIYPNHPQSCKDYRCQLLKSLSSTKITYQQALDIINQTKGAVSKIDYILFPIIGNREEVLEEYIQKFLKVIPRDLNLTTNILKTFGTYKFLRYKYFDL